MRILVADKFPENYLAEFKAKGYEVDYQPKLGENELAGPAKVADVIVVRSTVVNADTIKSSDTLKLVIRAGSGVNNIDVNVATEKGVAVANTPGKNAVAVAELAMGLIISLDRRIPDNVIDFRNGVWNKAEYSKADGLLGKTLSVIGTGNIGSEVAKRAQAFGMKVYGYDIVKVNSPYFENVDSLEKAVEIADIISLHLPSNAKTKGMFNKEMFARMKTGAMLINTSRHQIVNEDDLLEAVESKKLKVGMDVFLTEPEGKDGAVSSKLQNNPKIYVTHHIGASTEQAQDAVAQETVRVVNTFAANGEVLNKVN